MGRAPRSVATEPAQPPTPLSAELSMTVENDPAAERPWPRPNAANQQDGRLPTRIGAALIAIGLGLSGCGTLSRLPEGGARPSAAILPLPDPRISAHDVRLVATADAAVANTLAPLSILALSGGGANGAYGAGVLVGWSESGRRPAFRIVTGVSTGALTAPFAFLGPAWDPQLQSAYADGQAKDILAWRPFVTFVTPSLYSASALRRLVDRAVTPAMLQAIAVEHTKGRRLLVVTTNLDKEESVVWDMGVIAAQGGERGLKLFKDVLVASASIPGIFPPVLIAGRSADGRLTQEMHVDGGVNTPFLAVPESLMLWTRSSPAQGGGVIYVLVNGKLARLETVTKGRFGSILKRTIDSSGKASLRVHLTATAAFSERNGVDLEVAAVPEDAEARSLDFSRAAMLRVFELGRARGRGEAAWAPARSRLSDPR